MTPFDPMQELPPGTTLIEASAGTGKTYTITTLVLRLLLEQGLRIEEILVVTFTEAATAELQHRIRGRLREALERFETSVSSEDELLEALYQRVGSKGRPQAIRRLRAALTSFDLAAISTIHGFCKRMLQENAFESGVLFDTELIADQEPLLRELVRDFWSRRTHDIDPVFARYLQDRRVGPESLMSLAWSAADPDLPVLPQASQIKGEQHLDEAALRQHFGLFRGQWSAQGKALLSALVKMRWDLRGMDYFEDNLRSHAFAVDDYVSTAVPHLPPEGLKVFSRSRLLEAAAGKSLPASPLIDQISSYLDAVEMASQDKQTRLLRLRRDLVEHVRSKLPEIKDAQNIQSFDDLLHGLRDGLRDPVHGQTLASAISTRYRAALIDEFQDTDPVQYEIFSSCFAKSGGHLFLIGDPKQAIYAFRGADVFAYMQAVQEAGQRAFTLNVNWRSDPSLILAVNQLFTRLEHPFVFDRIGFQPVQPRPKVEDTFGGAALHVVHIPLKAAKRNKAPIPKTWLNKHLPPAVAGDIARMLDQATRGGFMMGDSELGPGDIAVLVRTNQQAIDIEEALRKLGIPSVRQGDSSVLDSAEASQLEALMAAVVDPGDRGALRGALATELMGYQAHEIANLEHQEGEWDTLIQRFQGWKTLWETQSLSRMFREVLEAQALQERLLSLVDGERRLTNLLHLVELLNTAALEQSFDPLSLLRWMRLERDSSDTDPGGAEARKLRLESDSQAVQLVTIHKSKGLEYPVVFCPYLWDARLAGPRDETLCFHDENNDGLRTLDIGSANFSAHRAQTDLETRAEDLRLLYVALTRARHRCVLYWGPFRNHEISPLGTLLHQPPAAGMGQTSLDRSSQAILGLNDARMRGELEALAAASDGRISVRGLDNGIVPEFQVQGRLARNLESRTPEFKLDTDWRIGSFSRLAHGAHAPYHAAPSPQAELGVDHDHGAHLPSAELEPALPITLSPFPRGAQAGTFFHQILEDVDFQDLSALDELVTKNLADHGFEEHWTPLVSQALREILETPFAPDLALQDIPQSARLDELQFTLPVASGLGAALEPDSLAQVLEDSQDPGLPPGYAQQIRALGFPRLRGFLTGFVDLIFLHQERWYVVDYKSNHLGDGLEAYHHSKLPKAMAESHYVLQYLLYTVALHRFLKQRLPDYSYETHMGGVYYLYLKGMHPSRDHNHGCYAHRPTWTLIRGLDELLRTGVQA